MLAPMLPPAQTPMSATADEPAFSITTIRPAQVGGGAGIVQVKFGPQ